MLALPLLLLLAFWSVVAGSPTLTIAPEATVAGSVVSVTGAGFDRNESGTLSWDGAPTGVKYRASSRGDFRVSFTVPTTADPGKHEVAAIPTARAKAKGTKTTTVQATALAVVTIVAATLSSDTPTPTPASTTTPSAISTPNPSPNPTATPPPVAGCNRTLQEIIDAAGAGTVVQVPACVYRETVYITKSLVLRASGATVDGEGIRTYGVVVTADDVTLSGLEVQRTTNGPQDGAIRVRSSNQFTLRDANVHDAAGACISISGGFGHRIENSVLAHCGQEGFHLTRVSDVVMAGNQIHHNNASHAYDMEWEAGGGKASHSQHLTFDSNEVYSNGGPGLWCDLDCHDVTYTNNRLHHNDWAGIMFEISDGAVISGNQAWENGWAKTTWGWGAGILIASSRNVDVSNNTVAWNGDGISVISQDRSSSYAYQPGVSTWNDVVNINVHDNYVIVAPRSSETSDTFLTGWLQDWGGVMFDGASRNLGTRDRYWDATAEPSSRFAWNGSISRLADFNATPGEEDGVYISNGERDAVLQATGMPTSGEPH
jgi:parallel beta-helix repeat protein